MTHPNGQSGISRRTVLGLLPLSMLLGSCGGSTFTISREQLCARTMLSTLLSCISRSVLPPPPTARAIAIVTTAMYDAWACYDSVANGTTFGGQLRQPRERQTRGNRATAIVHAAMHTLLDLFPNETDFIKSQVTSLNENPDALLIVSSSPEMLAYRVATTLLSFRSKDGSNQSNQYQDTTGYRPLNSPSVVNDASRWQPLRDKDGNDTLFSCPHWGTVVPFALSNPSVLRPRSAPDFASPTYMAQLHELLSIIETLDDKRKVIAEYWADGPKSVRPPGHWLIIAMYAAERHSLAISDEIALYFALGNAMLDASIACWDTKRSFDTSRPITAIRFLMKGKRVPGYVSQSGGIQWVDGENWQPFQSSKFITPPFAEYTSGHSTFSAAGAAVCRAFCRSDSLALTINVPKGSSAVEEMTPKVDITLEYPTFTAAADQAGMSRRYGGIHFEAADIEGRIAGNAVASYVTQKVNLLRTGQQTSKAHALNS